MHLFCKCLRPAAASGKKFHGYERSADASAELTRIRSVIVVIVVVEKRLIEQAERPLGSSLFLWLLLWPFLFACDRHRGCRWCCASGCFRGLFLSIFPNCGPHRFSGLADHLSLLRPLLNLNPWGFDFA